MRVTISRLAKFGSQLKELRIHLCQTDSTSKGVRDFIQNGYVQLKNDNPKLPILIRECSGVQARAYARFEMGVEKSVPLTNLAAQEVLKSIETIAK